MALTDLVSDIDYERYACNVSINKQGLPQGFQIISVQVKQAYQYISSAQILLKQDVGFGEINQSPFAMPFAGAAITIKANLEFEEIELFDGIIVSHKYMSSANGTRLKITAKTKAIHLAINTKTEVFAKQTDKNIIEDIISSHGCSMVTSNLTTQFKVKHSHLVKNELNDWDFINIRAEANGVFVFTEKDKVTIDKPTVEESQMKIITCQYGDNVFDLELEQDDRKFRIDHEMISFNLTDFEHETTKEDAAPTADLLKDPIKGKKSIINYRTFNDQENKDSIDAKSLLKSLSKLTGLVHIKPNLLAKPGSTIEISGFNDLVDGKYIITSVLHDYSHGGFNSYLQFGLHHESYVSKYNLHQSSRPSVIVTGVVTKLQDDPDNLNRIEVKVSGWKDAQEPIWARISSIYAGEEYGLCCLPEIGDEVIIGFMGNDFDVPVVLGSLFSPKKPPHIESSDDNHKKVFITKKGMKWSWDDEKVIHEISTPKGNKIVISDDEESITIEDKHNNKIVMNDSEISLTGNKDITIKATMNVKIEGVGIELNATGNAKLKGNPVNIN